MVDWGREKIMHHFLDGNNIGLVFSRQATDKYWSNIQVTTSMIDNRYHFSYKGIPQIAPLYLYPEMSNQTTTYQHIGRLPNLNKEILLKISDKLSFTFTVEKESSTNTFAPIDVLDYTYAVLYSPTYRSKFNEFLKIDFPRVPYPQDADTFWKLVKLGGELRQIHLLESPIVNKFITTYPVNGSNNVTKLKYEDGKVRINLDQYFDHVPQVAWEFYIGGYQPAQKWLKDRKGRVLSYEDIQHYQKIIVALVETDRIMKEIDCVEILN
jgi:predicted helicase